MSNFVPPLRLDVVEYRKIMIGGNTKPRLVVARNQYGQTKQMVLKLRDPADSVSGGHYAGTSLACELICAVLARAIGLSVPDYAIVEITPTFANSIHDISTRKLLLKNIGPNFGSFFHKSFAQWQPMSLKPSREFIDRLEDVLSFDSIVINGDRQISKPNLLYRGNRMLLIDHSLALPVHLWKQQSLMSSPFLPEEHIKKHCASQHLMKQGRSYSRVFDFWQERVNAQRLVELRAMIPVSWERRQGDIDSIFNFLGSRSQRFSEMSNALKGVLS